MVITWNAGTASAQTWTPNGTVVTGTATVTLTSPQTGLPPPRDYTIDASGALPAGSLPTQVKASVRPSSITSTSCILEDSQGTSLGQFTQSGGLTQSASNERWRSSGRRKRTGRPAKRGRPGSARRPSWFRTARGQWVPPLAR